MGPSRRDLGVWIACLVLVAACRAPQAVCARRLQQPAPPAAPLPTDNATSVAHECLWTPPTPHAAARAAAIAVASADAAAVAGSSAVATASASAVAAPPPAGACSLNPSVFFSLQAPALDGERLLLQITAMRYACLNHTSEAACSADQAAWCNWHDEGGRCELFFQDVDFVHFALWSSTRLACAGSKLDELVACSFAVSAEQCGAKPQCAWAEGACYPSFYAPLTTKPRSLAAFKRQVHVGDAAVWGSCAGADLYRRYSSVCNFATADACRADAACRWLDAWDADVLPNPLNLTKPCFLSTARFPVESVFLEPAAAAAAGSFSAAIYTAQRGCISAASEAECTANTTTLAASSLDAALSYAAGATQGGNASAPINSSSSNAFAAAWAPVGSSTPRAPPGAAAAGPDKPPPGGSELLQAAESRPAAAAAVAGASAKARQLAPAAERDGTIAGMLLPKPLRAVKPAAQVDAWSGFAAAAAEDPVPGGCSTPATCLAAHLSLRTLHVLAPLQACLAPPGAAAGAPASPVPDSQAVGQGLDLARAVACFSRAGVLVLHTPSPS